MIGSAVSAGNVPSSVSAINDAAVEPAAAAVSGAAGGDTETAMVQSDNTTAAVFGVAASHGTAVVQSATVPLVM